MKKWLCVIMALLLAACAGGLAEGAKPLPAELDARLHADLQARIDGILSTETEIVKSDERIPGKTYTGTAYYVSPDGNDEWNGLTPQTAKQTLQWALNERVKGMKPEEALACAKELGLDFTEEELKQAAENQPLSLDELEMVAGGRKLKDGSYRASSGCTESPNGKHEFVFEKHWEDYCLGGLCSRGYDRYKRIYCGLHDDRHV